MDLGTVMKRRKVNLSRSFDNLFVRANILLLQSSEHVDTGRYSGLSRAGVVASEVGAAGDSIPKSCPCRAQRPI